MKIGGAPSVVKQVCSALRGALKSKSKVVKGKTAHALRSKIAVLDLIKNKKIFIAISQKINSLFGNEECRSYSSNNMALTVSAASASDEMPCGVPQHCAQELDYLSNELFESDRPADNCTNADCLTEGRMSTCSVEDEIDILAEDFIRRFRAQMHLQKQDSFKRYTDMINRSV